MALWLTRMGRHGEYEQRFLADDRIYATWKGLRHDLSQIPTKAELVTLMSGTYPNKELPAIRNWASQIWPFVKIMKPGDWVVVPYKTKPAINIAEITGDYEFDPNADDPYYHSRSIKWIEQDIPRTNFDQDLLYSFGAFMTICRITRNDAENRVREMAKVGWKSSMPKPDLPGGEEGEADDTRVNLEEVARDQIAKLIMARFSGHDLARLIEAVLQAEGYTTFRSPEGPDKGIDILASQGPLGFEQPRICVQVKSGDTPVDLPTMNQLIGAMQNVQADHGLFVSWGGFKTSVDKEVPSQFFRVRFWNRDSIIDAILEHYDDLDEDLQQELPLKQIWAVAAVDEEEV